MQLATTNHLHQNGRISPASIAFYEARAKGGVGCVVTESLATDPTVGRGGVPAYDDETRPGFARLAEALHDRGALIIGQLNHGGRQHLASEVPRLVGPSSLACPYSGGTPHALDIQEIRSIVEGFTRSAANLQAAGLDGVEVHAGQGHLIQEFLSPFSNNRMDDYGGSPGNRVRFLFEILDGIRSECGPTFVVGLRLGAEEFTDGGLHLSDSKEIAKQVASRGQLDYVSVTQGNFNSIAHHTPDRRFPTTPYVGFAGEIRSVVSGLPVVACGRILTPDAAEKILRTKAADIIGLCRPLLADPDWVRKAQGGRPDEIRRCISCNQCWGWISRGRPIGCVHNATTGRELTSQITPAARRKRVLIVGGGPAGLEAARVSALRGHEVTLLEGKDGLGGAVVDASSAPGDHEIGWVADYLVNSVRRAGVLIRTSSFATPETVLATGADVVVIATGATDRTMVPGLGPATPVCSGRAALSDSGNLVESVLILDQDGYYEPIGVARHLASRGAKVYMATRFFEVGREIPATSRISALADLDQRGVTFFPTTWLEGSGDGCISMRNVLSNREWKLEGIDRVVVTGDRVADDGLYRDLAEKVGEIYRIGDAYMPRRIADAVREGHDVGLRI
jgi:2,4-dienoyl-CoA reductase-like NADH-dependent reductase (Old Yellow Enzyme family)